MATSSTYPRLHADWRRVRLTRKPRELARDLALRGLYARYRASGELEAGLAVPRIQFFCMHHLFPDEVGPFRKTMKVLSRYYDFVSWSEGVRRVLSGDRPDRPLACFSSDDGFASNMALAGVLEEFGARACLFVNPATLDATDPAFVARFCQVRLQARPAKFLTSADVDRLLARGHEVGNHTMTHVVCSETPLPRLAIEIEEAHSLLERRFGPVVHLAWPYGQFHHFSETARQLVFESGHISAASVVRGAHLLKSEPAEGELCLRRDQLWALDPVEHILYFGAKNALYPEAGEPNGFPGLTPGHEHAAQAPSGLSAWDEIPLSVAGQPVSH